MFNPTVFVITVEGEKGDMFAFKEALYSYEKTHPAIEITFELIRFTGGK